MIGNSGFLLSEEWGNIKYLDELVVFGTGRIGRRILPALSKQFQIPFLIDNKDAGDRVLGIEVVGLCEGLHRVRERGSKIVITTMRGAYQEISNDLERNGLKENVDFCIFERFAQEWNLRWQKRCVLAKIDTVITSKCTLKCKYCNIFIGHNECPKDIGIDELKRNFDIFFDCIDYVYEYTLLGGEPFRHDSIGEIILYLGERYGKRIGRINLISNGTIIPEVEVLHIMKSYNVSIHISDYTDAVGYSERLESLKRTMEMYGIEYYIIPNNVWKDMVYPDMSYEAEDPKAHMLNCGHSTHSVGDGKLYWCDPAYAAERFMGYQAEKNDYVDLSENKKTHSPYEASCNILNYLLGDMPGKGYMSLCKKCAGIGIDNERIVEVGGQG